MAPITTWGRAAIWHHLTRRVRHTCFDFGQARSRKGFKYWGTTLDDRVGRHAKETSDEEPYSLFSGTCPLDAGRDRDAARDGRDQCIEMGERLSGADAADYRKTLAAL